MILYILLIISFGIVLYVNFSPVFGDKPNTEQKSHYQKISKNYINGKFHNLIPTNMDFSINEKYKSDFVVKHSTSKIPKIALPNIKFDKSSFLESKDNLVTWFGHSTILLKLDQKSILIDPVFNRASPLPYLLGPASFKFDNKQSVDDIPNRLDIILITHDHYDHLDYRTIKKLNDRTNKFLVPLSVKAHLLKWNIPSDKIVEFDWDDSKSFEDIEFIFTPTRHFSGRALRDRFATLWGGWIIKSKSNSLYISGDGGYSEEFKKIGDKYGPFDLVFIENGAYNPRWHNVHLFPEQGVQACIDAGTKYALPIHWGKFNLSFHNWTEPIERFKIEAEKKNLSMLTPLIGQTFIINKEFPTSTWWEKLE